MRIAYLTMDNPHNLSGWSGLTYFIGESLKNAGNDLEYLYGFSAKTSLLSEIKQKIYPKLSGKFLKPNRHPSANRQYTGQIETALKGIERPDFLFSNSSELIAAAPGDIPKAFWVDACFAGMLGYYPDFDNIHAESIRKANEVEQKAYDKASVIFFASDWAAKSAVRNYAIDERKVKVVPFGANLLHSPGEEEIAKLILSRSNDQQLKLLFTGIYWDRKGGPLAVEITEALIKKGINAELIITGCEPFINRDKPDFVRQSGFLDKNDPAALRKLENFFKEAHFLLVPSKAECYGLVYCEGNAYGLPALARKTGGVPTIIRDNINGCTFEENATAEEYANYIQRYFEDKLMYQELAKSSFKEFKQRLNWKVAGGRISEILNELKH